MREVWARLDIAPGAGCSATGNLSQVQVSKVVAYMSAGPAIASLFIPGLGQACQGRKLAAFMHFVIAMLLWVGTLGVLGWAVNVCSAFGAASWRPK